MAEMIGQVESFNENKLAEYVEMLIDADEVERALLVIENVPGFYRDNPTLKMQQLKRDILSALVTPHAYLASNLDDVINEENSPNIVNNLLRGILVQREVARYNKQGKKPHIVDVGPGEYFIPLGLKRMGLNFTYYDIAMDQKTQSVAHALMTEYRIAKPEAEQPIIFLALEIIEHLPSTQDLVIEALRHSGRWPDRIHLSTPCYTFDGRANKDWRKPCGLPHLRTYTPKEFMAETAKLFPQYQLEFYPSQIMSIRGMRQDKIDSEPIYQTTGE